MLTFVVLVLVVVVLVISIAAFAFLIVRAARREMYLCAALIKQMEISQQSERKSLNKSVAFASASHDIRAALAGISGLTTVCRDEVAPGSELDASLMQIEACTKDLLGILNTVLDTSKIEAGKMQLEEEEFDLAQLLEDVVDLYHPVGMKSGVDVLLDPCDGSLSKFSKVKGDRTKLKQILCNLLSNAVKFTSEGHVAVRAWAKKPNFNKSIFSSRQNNSLHCLKCLLFKNDEVFNGLESMNTDRENEHSVEFIFEVDDTGRGIPKEKKNSVFENYVQIKETALPQEGTGLGLGIVQSLVRLMGGEIQVMDKEIGEKGTCFRFNTFLTHETELIGNEREDDIESQAAGYISGDSFHHSGTSTCITSPKREGSHVVLFIQSDTRQKISQRFMEMLGIKVSAVKEWEQLPHTLKKIKQKMNLSIYSSSDQSEVLSSRTDCMSSLSRPLSCNSSAQAKDIPLSALDGIDHVPSLHRRTNTRGVPNFIMIVIDTSAGPFRQLSRAVAEFRRDLYNTTCRIVWINKPGARSIHLKGLNEDKLPPTDLIISKPFHGSRLYHVIGLLPEFGGTFSPGKRRQNLYPSEIPPSERFSSNRAHVRSKSNHGGSSSEKLSNGKEILVPAVDHNLPAQQGEIQEQHGNTSREKPLLGKKILVADDNAVLRKLARSLISKLGAAAETCENGGEALELVCRGLSEQRKHGTTEILPFNYILMDCEMPIMDGFEATRRIREEEAHYGVHIPIIALTSHTKGEETNRMMQAGVDFHLVKPLEKEQLMGAIACINRK